MSAASATEGCLSQTDPLARQPQSAQAQSLREQKARPGLPGKRDVPTAGSVSLVLPYFKGSLICGMFHPDTMTDDFAGNGSVAAPLKVSDSPGINST